MREIKFIVIHCSATRVNTDYTPEQLDRDHKLRGFIGAGYHFYIRKSGEVVRLRPDCMVPAHVKGYNRKNMAICYEGGLDEKGKTCGHPDEGTKRVIDHLIEKHALPVYRGKNLRAQGLICRFKWRWHYYAG